MRFWIARRTHGGLDNIFWRWKIWFTGTKTNYMFTFGSCYYFNRFKYLMFFYRLIICCKQNIFIVILCSNGFPVLIIIFSIGPISFFKICNLKFAILNLNLSRPGEKNDPARNRR